ncbi:MAG: hypothetical protein IIA08_08400 [Proteobacteria bacterium]|nr:hypothetical protein [Pseudomonadota bacterium]
MIRAVLTAVFFLSAPAVLACDYPSRPAEIPDGSVASQDEMFVGVKAINAYQTAMQEYLDCIDADEKVAVTSMDDADDKTKKKRATMYNKKYNAAVEEMTLVVEQFNVEIRAYKQRSK